MIVYNPERCFTMERQEYLRRVKETERGVKLWRDCIRAFLVGGLICIIGEALFDFYITYFPSPVYARSLVSITLIFLACLFTGIGWFDSIAKFAGAGTLVPITGFANAVASPAIDCKSEGLILGVGAKMFTIAGPVIVYGTVASVVYGIIYWITTLF